MRPGSDESEGAAREATPRPHIRDLDPEELEKVLEPIFGARPSHLARVLAGAVHRERAIGAEEVFRAAGVGRRRAPLVESAVRLEPLLSLDRVVRSADDGGARMVLSVNRLGGREAVEAVTIPQRADLTLCLSSQAGCALACSFCATGRLGFRSNLTAGEIVEQHAWAERTAGRRVTNVVFMGMGEPLLNYDEVLRAAYLLAQPAGAQVSRRNIVISTAGVVPRIRRYVKEGHPFPLFFSITSAIPEKRRRLMPIEETYPLEELREAILEYVAARRRNRFATLEYVAIPDENMGDEDVGALGDFVKGMQAIIDVIPYNAAPGSPYRPPTWLEVKAFTTNLRRIGTPVKVRYSSGKAVAAGCGQLAADRLPPAPVSGHMGTLPVRFSEMG